MSLGQRKSPSWRTGGSSQNTYQTGDSATSSVPHRLDPEVFEHQLNGCYIVVVQVRSDSPEPRYRRRFYVNLSAAQRAVDRATMDGRTAHLFLAQLHIVPQGARRIGLDVDGVMPSA